jgi:hypothetical protein
LRTSPLPEDDPRQRCPDISLAQNLLAWAPRVQLRDGLMKTIEYFERLLRLDPGDERLPDPLGQSRGLSPKHRSGPCPARFGFVLPKIEI